MHKINNPQQVAIILKSVFVCLDIILMQHDIFRPIAKYFPTNHQIHNKQDLVNNLYELFFDPVFADARHRIPIFLKYHQLYRDRYTLMQNYILEKQDIIVLISAIKDSDLGFMQELYQITEQQDPFTRVATHRIIEYLVVSGAEYQAVAAGTYSGSTYQFVGDSYATYDSGYSTYCSTYNTYGGGTYSAGTYGGGTYGAGTYGAGTYSGGTYSAGTYSGGTYSGGTYGGGTYGGGTYGGGTYSGGTYGGGTYGGGTYSGGTYGGGTYSGGTYSGGTYGGGTYSGTYGGNFYRLRNIFTSSNKNGKQTNNTSDQQSNNIATGCCCILFSYSVQRVRSNLRYGVNLLWRFSENVKASFSYINTCCISSENIVHESPQTSQQLKLPIQSTSKSSSLTII